MSMPRRLTPGEFVRDRHGNLGRFVESGPDANGNYLVTWTENGILAKQRAVVPRGDRAALAAHAKANDFVDGKIAPLRKVVKFDHAIMRHVFEHVEAEEARAGRPRHTLKQVKQEAEQADDLLEE